MARGPGVHAAVRANRRSGRGRGREGRGVHAQGLRHVHGRHLLWVRGHRHPHLALPPHGHLRAPHQTPGLPAGLPRRRQAPRRRPTTPTWPEQAPEPAHGGGGAAGGGPVGADAGAAIPDVPGAAGAAAAVVPQGRGALAAARPPRFVHATLTYSSLNGTIRVHRLDYHSAHTCCHAVPYALPCSSWCIGV